MYLHQTMITGHLDHARFSGERFGRILNHLSRSHSVFRTGGSTRSLGEDVAGRIASMSDHCPCPTIVHARPLSMLDHCPCPIIVYASNRKPRRSDCNFESRRASLESPHGAPICALFCPPDGEIMPRGGRMTPEPVPSGCREKKLFFPRGEIICVRAGLPKKSVG